MRYLGLNSSFRSLMVATEGTVKRAFSKLAIIFTTVSRA